MNSSTLIAETESQTSEKEETPAATPATQSTSTTTLTRKTRKTMLNNSLINLTPTVNTNSKEEVVIESPTVTRQSKRRSTKPLPAISIDSSSLYPPSSQLSSQQPLSPMSTSSKTSINSKLTNTTNNNSHRGDNLISLIKHEPLMLQNQDSSSSSASSVTSDHLFEDEKAYKSWKKSIMMVYNNIACHKHATVFMHPVKEEIAPGYRNCVYRPMDLSTIKKNLESGHIKSTVEFQRDIMLMFTNAIMYNSSNHDIHKISLEMYKEVVSDIEQLLNAQETMGDDAVKPLRFKEIRSSTASDRALNLVNENEKSEQNESSISELNETSSIKSNSSISTPRTSNSNSNSNNNLNSIQQQTTSHASSRKSSTTTKQLLTKQQQLALEKQELEQQKRSSNKKRVSSAVSSVDLNQTAPINGSSSRNSSKEESVASTKPKRRKSGR